MALTCSIIGSQSFNLATRNHLLLGDGNGDFAEVLVGVAVMSQASSKAVITLDANTDGCASTAVFATLVSTRLLCKLTKDGFVPQIR
jgi:hypothetical protein